MMYKIGIRREDKNEFERRVPLIPEHVNHVHQQTGFRVAVQPSPRRIYLDEEYRQVGAFLTEELTECPIILGVKQIPNDQLQANKAYVFFSHTIKGQPSNMPLLRRILDLGCTLIDYERIVDEQGRRLVFFSRHAGLAGMVDSLWALGQRLLHEGYNTPFLQLKPTYAYGTLREVKDQLIQIGQDLCRQPLPDSLKPLIIGLTGYGNVSQGAQEVLDILHPAPLSPDELLKCPSLDQPLYKVVFHEEHMVHRSAGCSAPFDLQDYYQHPDKYQSIFARYLDHLTVLVNCIYWEPRYPRLVTLDDLRKLYHRETSQPSSSATKLKVIGDISCDIDGGIEATVRATSSDQPVYVYDVAQDQARNGFEGIGPVIMAVDNLPAELPRDASDAFSTALMPFVPALAAADFTSPLVRSGLPDPVRRAVITYRGELTNDYQYLERYL